MRKLSWNELAARRPARFNADEPILDRLSTRPLKTEADWSPFVVAYSADVLHKGWFASVKTEVPASLGVTVVIQEDTLQSKQRSLYDLIVRHYQQELDAVSVPDQLLLQVDGEGGTGKAYVVQMLCAKLNAMAVQADRVNLVLRTAPQGWLLTVSVISRSIRCSESQYPLIGTMIGSVRRH